MLQLLQLVDSEFDDRNIYANKSKVWLYVDWSPELNGDTPETRGDDDRICAGVSRGHVSAAGDW